MAQHSNEWYLNGLWEQSNEVIQAMVEDFLPMVIHFVTTNSGTRMDAEDLFQDALVVVYRKVQNGGLSLNENTKLSTYFFEICRRIWFKKLRQKKYDAGVTPEELPVSTMVVEDDLTIDYSERLNLLNNKFTILGDTCQKVLNLSWHTNKSMKEIAADMNWTYEYARKKKHECKEKLIGLIKGDRRYDELK